MRYLAAFLLFAIPAIAQDKKYPVSVQILASWDRNHTSIGVVSPTPSQTNCNGTATGDAYSPTQITMDCTTQPGHAGGAYEYVDRVDVTSLASVNSSPYISIACSANWALSRCVPLDSGKYWARWANKEHTTLRLLVRFVGQKKPKEIRYNVYCDPKVSGSVCASLTL